jgi:hypothetical protein
LGKRYVYCRYSGIELGLDGSWRDIQGVWINFVGFSS